VFSSSKSSKWNTFLRANQKLHAGAKSSKQGEQNFENSEFPLQNRSQKSVSSFLCSSLRFLENFDDFIPKGAQEKISVKKQNIKFNGYFSLISSQRREE